MHSSDDCAGSQTAMGPWVDIDIYNYIYIYYIHHSCMLLHGWSLDDIFSKSLICKDEIDKSMKKAEKETAKQAAKDEKEKKRLARQAHAEQKKSGKKGDEAEACPDGSEGPNGKEDGDTVPAGGRRKRRGGGVTAGDGAACPAGPAGSSMGKRRKNAEAAADDIDAAAAAAEKAEIKERKSAEAFRLVQTTGIELLKMEPTDKKSYTVRPPDGAKEGARGIGVLLSTDSFYVNRCMLDEMSWAASLSSLYRVGALFVILFRKFKSTHMLIILMKSLYKSDQLSLIRLMRKVASRSTGTETSLDRQMSPRSACLGNMPCCLPVGCRRPFDFKFRSLHILFMYGLQTHLTA